MTSQVIDPDGMTPLGWVRTFSLISCVDGMEVGLRDRVTGSLQSHSSSGTRLGLLLQQRLSWAGGRGRQPPLEGACGPSQGSYCSVTKRYNAVLSNET